MPGNLGLDKALVSVNRSSSLIKPLEVYYQLDECYGCPLERLKVLNELQGDFVVGTKYSLRLELRDQQTNGSSTTARTTGCKFNNLQLNNHGHYKIQVVESADGNSLECSMATLETGDCPLCPMAIVFCLLFAFTAIEKLYSRFWLAKRRKPAATGNGGAQTRPVNDGGANKTTTKNGQNGTAIIHLDMANGNSEPAPQPETAATEAQAQQVQQVAADTQAQSHGRGGTVRANRIEALDAFRGLTIAGMIFVNYGGAGYAALEHKAWDGITVADFVFPFFIFSMGASIALSARSLIERQERPLRSVVGKIFKRSCILFALGICLNSKWLTEEEGFSSLRITGVLQRFSISYLVVALVHTIGLTVNKWIKAQSLSHFSFISRCLGDFFAIITAINNTAIYIYVTFYLDYSVDGKCPPGYIGPGGMTANGQYADCTGGAAAWLDRLLFGESHLYNDRNLKQIFKTKVTHDPEGALGYTTSILLTLIGLQCGKILSKKQSHKVTLVAIIQWIVALAVTCLLVLVIPVNKRLWSLTFVSLTGLSAFLVMMALYILLDVYLYQKTFLLRLLLSAGKNSIFLYVAHSVLHGMLPWWFPVGDVSSHLQLLLRLTWSTLAWLLVAHYMAIKGLFIKI